MTALTDLKLYYFLDQGRQNDSFAGFSCFFIYMKIICQTPNKNFDCKIQTTFKENSNFLNVFSINKHCLQYIFYGIIHGRFPPEIFLSPNSDMTPQHIFFKKLPPKPILTSYKLWKSIYLRNDLPLGKLKQFWEVLLIKIKIKCRTG